MSDREVSPQRADEDAAEASLRLLITRQERFVGLAPGLPVYFFLSANFPRESKGEYL